MPSRPDIDEERNVLIEQILDDFHHLQVDTLQLIDECRRTIEETRRLDQAHRRNLEVHLTSRRAPSFT
jgi:hypothetical protein